MANTIIAAQLWGGVVFLIALGLGLTYYSQLYVRGRYVAEWRTERTHGTYPLVLGNHLGRLRDHVFCRRILVDEVYSVASRLTSNRTTRAGRRAAARTP